MNSTCIPSGSSSGEMMSPSGRSSKNRRMSVPGHSGPSEGTVSPWLTATPSRAEYKASPASGLATASLGGKRPKKYSTRCLGSRPAIGWVLDPIVA